MSVYTFVKLRLDVSLLDVHERFTAANGQSLNVVGLARVRMTLGRTTFDINILVADLGRQKRILLGRDVYALYPPFARPILDLEQAVRASTEFLRTPFLCKLDDIEEETETVADANDKTSTQTTANSIH